MPAPPRVALRTAAGRGAVAVIEAEAKAGWFDDSGLFVAANGMRLADARVGRILFGRWGSGDVTEELVVVRTTPERFEIQCHGGTAAASKILSDLEAAGATVVPSDAWPLTGGDLLDEELARAVIAAKTLKVLNVILEQQSGLLRNALDELGTLTDRDVIRERLSALRRLAPLARLLIGPAAVVLIGRPNVGKSSLINRLLGYERAIVFDQPGTTRDVLDAETAIGGWPVTLSDTAGVRETDEVIEAEGVRRAERAAAAADLKLLLLNRGEAPTPEDERLLTEHPDALIIAHQSDRPDSYGPSMPTGALLVSSLTGEGLDTLLEQIAIRLTSGEDPAGRAVLVSRRQLDVLREAEVACESGSDAELADAVRRLRDG